MNFWNTCDDPVISLLLSVGGTWSFLPSSSPPGCPQCETRFQSLLFTLLGSALAPGELLRCTFSTRFQIHSLTVFCAIHGHQYLQLIKCSAPWYAISAFLFRLKCCWCQFDRIGAIFGLSWSRSDWWCPKWPECGWKLFPPSDAMNIQADEIWFPIWTHLSAMDINTLDWKHSQNTGCVGLRLPDRLTFDACAELTTKISFRSWAEIRTLAPARESIKAKHFWCRFRNCCWTIAANASCTYLNL